MPRPDGKPTIPEILGFRTYDEMHAAHEREAADRTHKPWPVEEDCPGCPNHRNGPHKMDCSVAGRQQLVLSVTGRLHPAEPNLQNIPIRTPEGVRVSEHFSRKKVR